MCGNLEKGFVVSVKFDFDEKAVEKAALAAFASVLDDAFRKAGPRILSRVGDLVSGLIRTAPEAASLLDPRGKLRGELGVVSARGPVEQVASAVAGAMAYTHIPFKVVGNQVKGGLEIGVVRRDLSEVAPVMDAVAFVSEKGYEVDWLRWLLTGGDDVIIFKSWFSAGTQYRTSRTGLGIMKRGKTWRVPSEFSGTYANNWLTRSLHDAGEPFLRIVKEELSR